MSDAPLTYLRDDVRQQITVTITGPARLADLVSAVERQAAEGTWSYSLLYDECTGTASLSASATRAFLAVVDRLTRAHGPSGPVAMVCAAVEQFGMARMYSILGEHQGLDSEFRGVPFETSRISRVAYHHRAVFHRQGVPVHVEKSSRPSP